MPIEPFDNERTDPETGEISDGPTPRQAIVNHMKTVGGGFPYNKAKIPMDSEFGSDEYLASPELEDIAETLIAEWSMDAFDAKILFRWKKTGGNKGGRATMGQCSKLGGVPVHLSRCQFMIWIAADHCRTAQLTNYQLEALLHHELLHIVAEEDKDKQIKLVLAGHDYEGFYLELERYGDWMTYGKQAKSAWQQAKLIPEGYVGTN